MNKIRDLEKKMSLLVPPHGGKLIDNHVMSEEERYNYVEKAKALPKLELNERGLADLECIATGVYSPLTGFMNEKDYNSVVENMHLSDGTVWPIPVTLTANESFATSISKGSDIALTWNGTYIGIMNVSDIYQPDKKKEALNVYQTDDSAHPGVAALYQSESYYLGGEVKLIDDIPHKDFLEYRYTPKQTREEFAKRGWKTVVAFQTRNPIHRAHEYLQKVALESVDGLFINPLVGATKSDDVPVHVRMETYKVILNAYYPKDRFFLGVFPANMRYAGPREAIMHAIARQNYGCSHFIVGRDHAGVGNYYGTYDAQKIFDNFTDEELKIKPFKFEHAFYCKICEQMVTRKTCPHGKESHIYLSGTKVREMLREGKMLPREFTRPEVALILSDAYNGNKTKVEQKGVTLLFTGLSGSGKTTITKALAQELKKRGYRVERLDGDVVRQYLTKDLGFSKRDRDENIRRVGFVAHMLTRNNVIVLMANIAPYQGVRDEIRQLIGDFMEVYVHAPIEVCEERDVKGLYKKAKAGEILNFTGVNDPYEPPTNPEITCYTEKETVEESVNKVLAKMVEYGYIDSRVLER
ncbi:MAG: sulfate adenylyltransferase [Candidatus Heimdallarchaeaceae archaeon]